MDFLPSLHDQKMKLIFIFSHPLLISGHIVVGSTELRCVPLGSAGFHWVPLGFAGFCYTDVFNDRLLVANLQLVPGCYTLAA